MTFGLLRALLFVALAAPTRAGQVQGPISGEFQTGTQTGAIGASLTAPLPIQLTVPSLALAGSPSLAAAAVAPAPVAGPVAAAARVEAIPALPASAVAGSPGALAEGPQPAASAQAMATSPEGGSDAGRALFDQSGARPASGGVWDAVKNLLSIGEAAPAWPGKAGDAVRVGNIKTALGKVAGDGGTSRVWTSNDGHYAVKLLHPGARAVPGANEEAATLRAIAGTDLPVAKLVAESADGRVLVKELIEGDTAAKILDRGAFSRSQAQGWPELAAKLIQGGVSADLARGNLVWQHWRTRWVVVDAGGLSAAPPRAALEQLLAPELLTAAGLEPAAFLAGVRARLGPDSPHWAAAAETLRGMKAGAPALAALARLDAEAPAGPAVVFGPAARRSAAFDNTVVSTKELNKRLGYDPLTAKKKYKLHGDDPGKLNTVILDVSEPAKTSVVVKQAQWDIIRNEAALRRLAGRFFGRYFRTPEALSVNRGYDSYMVMEKLDAAPSYYQDAFTLEQRVAAALFIKTFGVSDVNPGNVLAAKDGGLPWLIDFEQAFGRSNPVAGRIPDERIAQEMPWMSRRTINRAEDYQPAARAWRAELAKPGVRAAILADLAASGFDAAEAAALLARFDLNAADLDWALQNDADFVNQFVDRSSAQR